MNEPTMETLVRRLDLVERTAGCTLLVRRGYKYSLLNLPMIIVALGMVFSLMSPNLALSQPSISNLWKARALDAADKVEVLNAKLDKMQWESKEAQRVRCEVMVEFAYGMHVAQEDIVHKFDESNEYFHFILNGGPEAGLFDLIYIYSPAGKLLATRIDMLPKKWQLIFLIPGKVQLLMPNNGCLFYFDLNDPFAGEVLD